MTMATYRPTQVVLLSVLNPTSTLPPMHGHPTATVSQCTAGSMADGQMATTGLIAGSKFRFHIGGMAALAISMPRLSLSSPRFLIVRASDIKKEVAPQRNGKGSPLGSNGMKKDVKLRKAFGGNRRQ